MAARDAGMLKKNSLSLSKLITSVKWTASRQDRKLDEAEACSYEAVIGEFVSAMLGLIEAADAAGMGHHNYDDDDVEGNEETEDGDVNVDVDVDGGSSFLMSMFEMELMVLCSQLELSFKSFKSMDHEKAYQLLLSAQSFLRGPKRCPTVRNLIYYRTSAFLSSLWTSADCNKLKKFREELATMYENNSLPSPPPRTRSETL
jgi:hypothetical protein